MVDTANSVPSLSPSNTEAADDGTAALYAVQPKANPNTEDYGERSANLWADPKLRQLKKATTKKIKVEEGSQDAGGDHSKSLQRSGSTGSISNAGGAPVRKHPTLRTNGCDIVDWNTKLIASRVPMLPQVGSGTDDRYSSMFKHPEQALSLSSKAMARNPDLQKRHNAQAAARVQWRNTMDSSLKRLMMDMELCQDPAIGKRAHASSCNHLDKVHEWYLSHGKKEARKGMPGPSYLRYNAQDPVMPGSLRAPPQRFENPLGVGVGGGVSSLPGVSKRDLRGSQSEPSLLPADETMSNPTTPAHGATLKPA